MLLLLLPSASPPGPADPSAGDSGSVSTPGSDAWCPQVGRRPGPSRPCGQLHPCGGQKPKETPHCLPSYDHVSEPFRNSTWAETGLEASSRDCYFFFEPHPLHTGVTPGGAKGNMGVPDLEPGSASCKTSVLPLLYYHSSPKNGLVSPNLLPGS